jgi:hypothetical protein
MLDPGNTGGDLRHRHLVFACRFLSHVSSPSVINPERIPLWAVPAVQHMVSPWLRRG